MNLKKLLLVNSFFAICIVGLLYGVSPSWFSELFLMSPVAISIDQSHILRAIMMLYIGLGFFWLYCAFSPKYQDAGVLVLAIFCGGLVSGRILSVFIDGVPSNILIVYILMELSLIPVCVWLLKKN